MGADLDNSTVEKAYARWAPIYDLVFDKVMDAGRRAAVAAAMRAGPRILDVGIGTGLELRHFSTTTQLVGVDLSEPMMRKAQGRIRAGAMHHVLGLCVMDAARLAFADEAFDAVLAPYVITVVPEPQATLEELMRVIRPGGELVLVNHIGAERGARAVIERWLARQTHQIGWRPEFPWSQIQEWHERRPDVELVERRPVAPFGMFTLIRFRRSTAREQPVPRAA
jgi:phosphatidylethanolamine/phosphatidyl-N-methylethanolamine N-methyltransferase